VELVASGIKRICVVIRKGKEVIKDYLNGRKALYKEIEFHFAYQREPLGLGDAMRRAKEFIGGDLFMMAISSSCPKNRPLSNRWRQRI
jgi:dTDP-glucose pyrophosphorylase